MKDEEMVSKNTPLGRPTDLFYRPYGFLKKPALPIGKTAIRKAFVDLEKLLHTEVHFSPVEKFFDKNPISLPSRQREEGVHSDAKALKALKKLVVRSHEVLASATAVFPFDLFPDTISVDRTKVTITKRTFFWSSEVISIRIEDILNVSTSVGPFFGSVTVASRVMSTEDHFETNYFWRKDAIHLKHIIQGYVIAQHNKIDVAHLSRQDLIKALFELGHDDNA